MQCSSAPRRLALVLSGLQSPTAGLATTAAAAAPALALRQELVDAPQSGIRLLMAKSADLEKRPQPFGKVIHLEVGQPDFRTPSHILQATSDAVLNTESMTQYIGNAGLDRLRELVADKCSREAPNVPTSSDHILITPGAVMSMASAFAVGLSAGEEVLVPDPGWPNYTLSATVLSASAVPCVLCCTSVADNVGARI
jgi:aspartate/methionine/tyrosine aminotransferase